MLTSHEGDMKRPVDPDVGGEPTTPGQKAIVFTAKRFEWCGGGRLFLQVLHAETRSPVR